ncbi:MAG: nucleotidyltransferase [Bacteroidia bacterium]
MQPIKKVHPASAPQYSEFIEILNESKYPYLLGGAVAVRYYSGVYRDTKDLDIFCKPSDSLKILKYFDQKGFKTELYDARWLAKVFYDDYFMDIIFDTVNNICRVDDSWFQHAVEAEAFGHPVKIMSAEDLIWCKIYVQNRERYDGADINHLILKYGEKLNWNRVLDRLDQHWQLLLQHLINFQFVYPSDRDIVPRWLMEELFSRSHELYDLPASTEKVCRGPIIDQTQYRVDITDWNYKAVTIKTV